jgi:hypothetical protein
MEQQIADSVDAQPPQSFRGSRADARQTFDRFVQRVARHAVAVLARRACA